MATTTATITLASSDLLSNALSLSAKSNGIALGANKAHKLYLSNKATDPTYYVDVYVAALNIGRLYAGDWMFIPLEVAAATQDVGVEAIGAAQIIEWCFFHEGKTLGQS